MVEKSAVVDIEGFGRCAPIRSATLPALQATAVVAGKTNRGAAAGRSTPPNVRDCRASDRNDDPAQVKPRTVITGVAAELREFAKLVTRASVTTRNVPNRGTAPLGR